MSLSLRYFIVSLVFILSQPLQAQYLELGLMGGVANYRGDIPTNHLGIQQFSEAGGVFARYSFSPWLSAKVFINHAKIEASDYPGFNPIGNRRFLHFRTDIWEIGLQYEVHLTGFDILAGKHVSPYVFAGIEAYHFNPRTLYQGQWIDLQPLGTEGQTMDGKSGYNRFHPGIPFGIGFRFGLTSRMTLGFEVGARKTFTDYLDDVSGAYPDIHALYANNPMAAMMSDRTYEMGSQPIRNRNGEMRGNPATMDWFFVSGIHLSIHLGPKSNMEFDPVYKSFLE